MEGKWNYDSVRDAGGLFHATSSFLFMICLIVVSHCLEVTRPLTKQCQPSTFDVVAANKTVTFLFVTFRRKRMEIAQLHSRWHEEAETLASSVNIVASKPHTVQRQVHRGNTPSDYTSKYYERSVTLLPFLDDLISQLQARSSDRNIAYLNGFYAFPAKVVLQTDWEEKFMIYLDESKYAGPGYCCGAFEMIQHLSFLIYCSLKWSMKWINFLIC